MAEVGGTGPFVCNKIRSTEGKEKMGTECGIVKPNKACNERGNAHYTVEETDNKSRCTNREDVILVYDRKVKRSKEELSKSKTDIRRFLHLFSKKETAKYKVPYISSATVSNLEARMNKLDITAQITQDRIGISGGASFEVTVQDHKTGYEYSTGVGVSSHRNSDSRNLAALSRIVTHIEKDRLTANVFAELDKYKQQFKDPDEFVRGRAVRNYEILKGSPDKVSPLFKDNSSGVRVEAIIAYWRLGGSPDKLTPLFKDRSRSVRRQAVLAYWRLGGSPDRLIPLFKDGYPLVWQAAATGFARSVASPDNLISLVNDGAPYYVRRALVYAYGKLDAQPDKLLPIFKDPDGNVREIAVEAYGKLKGPPDKLLPLFKDPDENVREIAVEA